MGEQQGDARICAGRGALPLAGEKQARPGVEAVERDVRPVERYRLAQWVVALADEFESGRQLGQPACIGGMTGHRTESHHGCRSALGSAGYPRTAPSKLHARRSGRTT